MTARRSRKRRDWPRGLYEPRPGYFVWRHPETGKTYALGYIPLAVAKNEALAANAHVMGEKPGLVERLTGADRNISDVLDKMPVPRNISSARVYRWLDKLIRDALGTKTCAALTVADCASLIESIHAAGTHHTARQVRSRLIALCKRAMQLGWLDNNPASITADLGVEVRRERLTLEQFTAIFNRAPEVSAWLQHAMLLAVVTGQDVSTIAGMEYSHIQDGALIVVRGKTKRTNRPVAIPLALRLDVLGVSLAELAGRKTGVTSKYLLHHVSPTGGVSPGTPVNPKTISGAFKKARELASVGGEYPPTFHELRSLSKRLYIRQGNVDTKALLGHSSDAIADLYADPRGAEPIRVRVGVRELEVNKT